MKFLATNSPATEAVKSARQLDVRIFACGNSMRSAGLEEKDPAPGIGMVPAAIAHLARRPMGRLGLRQALKPGGSRPLAPSHRPPPKARFLRADIHPVQMTSDILCRRLLKLTTKNFEKVLLSLVKTGSRNESWSKPKAEAF
ncbi:MULTISPECIES: DsrE family protein [unclassified Arthrobacter]|uniref:DsrE family protein n=1 Tax=unclassified Arthrobacter TaxID=235627 RepID=UPI001F0D4A3B|nr:MULTISPECIES: DsrE family protein [unclassified Arthrobacter]